MAITWLATPLAAQEDWRRLYESGEIRDSQENLLRYRWMKPSPTAAALNSKFPLVVFLHGAGERGGDNQKQLVHCASDFARTDRREQQPAFVIFPQCAVDQKWADVDWTRRQIEFQPEPSQPMKLVFQLVDELIKTQPIDPQRIYLAGLSMGGYGTWHAIGLRPKFWASAIPVCGGADISWAEKIKDTPVWTFHGEQDQAVPVENTREMVTRLRSLKAPIEYTEYPSVDHDSWTQTFKDDRVHAWLFSQRRN